jgi:hypothetical protein
MALKTLYGVLLIGLLNSCNQQNTKNTQPLEIAARDSLPSLAELEGKRFNETQQLLGKPLTDDEYLFGNAILGEFRITLLNYFDIKDSTDQKKLIKEVTWRYGKEEGRAKFITVWYVKEHQQWKFLNLNEYFEGAEF